LECIGQRWRGHAKTAWRQEISSGRRGLSTKASAPFQYAETAAQIIIVVVAVAAIDLLSARIRSTLV
jgi:ABC-type phosphate/phosphonate transport system permease subunit